MSHETIDLSSPPMGGSDQISSSSGGGFFGNGFHQGGGASGQTNIFTATYAFNFQVPGRYEIDLTHQQRSRPTSVNWPSSSSRRSPFGMMSNGGGVDGNSSSDRSAPEMAFGPPKLETEDTNSLYYSPPNGVFGNPSSPPRSTKRQFCGFCDLCFWTKDEYRIHLTNCHTFLSQEEVTIISHQQGVNYPDAVLCHTDFEFDVIIKKDGSYVLALKFTKVYEYFQDPGQKLKVDVDVEGQSSSLTNH